MQTTYLRTNTHTHTQYIQYIYTQTLIRVHTLQQATGGAQPAVNSISHRKLTYLDISGDVSKHAETFLQVRFVFRHEEKRCFFRFTKTSRVRRRNAIVGARACVRVRV